MSYEFLTLEGYPQKRNKHGALRRAKKADRNESRRAARSTLGAAPAAPAAPQGKSYRDLFDALYHIKQSEGYQGVGELAAVMLSSEGLRLPNLSEEDTHAMGIATMATLSGYDFSGLSEEENLGRWSFRRMFTPPAAVRRAVTRATAPISRMITPPAAVKKVLRYAGAAAFTAGMPFGAGLFMGKQRNKIFGLKGGEIKTFDAAAKVGRIGAIAVVSVAGGAAILTSLSAPAAAGLSPLLSSSPALPAGLASPLTAGIPGASPLFAGAMGGGAPFSLATAGTGAGGGLLASATGFLKSAIGSKVGSFIIKDVAKEMVMKVVMNKMGQPQGEIYQRDQLPPEVYNSLPANTPIPAPSSWDQAGIAPTAAGAGSMEANGNTSGAGAEDGGDEIDGSSSDLVGRGSYAAIQEESALVLPDSRLDPATRANYLSPAQSERLRALVDQPSSDTTDESSGDDTPLKDLIQAAQKGDTTETSDIEREMLDGEPSLKAQAARIRRLRAPQPAPMGWKRPAPRPTAAPTPAPKPWTMEARAARMARLSRIVNE